jgi:hypothetical protein
MPQEALFSFWAIQKGGEAGCCGGRQLTLLMLNGPNWEGRCCKHFGDGYSVSIYARMRELPHHTCSKAPCAERQTCTSYAVGSRKTASPSSRKPAALCILTSNILFASLAALSHTPGTAMVFSVTSLVTRFERTYVVLYAHTISDKHT